MNVFKADDIFSDGMILQRGVENFITGSGKGEMTLTLERDDKICGRSRIAADGRWRIAVPEGKADCLPYTIKIRCGNVMQVISDVLFGDVFHITGQSNMELPLNRTYDPFKGDVPVPEEELIREYRVPIALSFEAGKESGTFTGGSWVRACDDKELNMSAAGYHFAKKLFAEIGVPIGLVNTSAGGSAIEGRIPAEVCREFHELDPVTDMVTADGYMERTLSEGEKIEKEWSAYPGAIAVWENNFKHVEQLFNYGSAVRKVMYTTNAIESVNSSFRKVTKKGSFPNDMAVYKIFYLRILELYKKWENHRGQNWAMVRNQLLIDARMAKLMERYDIDY